MQNNTSQIFFFAALMLSGGNVQAASFAVSLNTISNFSMSFTGAGQVAFSAMTFSTDSAADDVGNSLAYTNPLDALPACLSCSYNNSFISHGLQPATHVYGDAQIHNVNVLAGTGSASAIAEVGMQNGYASAAGNNKLLTGNSTFTIGAGGASVNYAFLANPYLATQLTGNGMWATAQTNFNITIRRTSNNQTVFNWSPNGSGAIVGGTVGNDPFSLNLGLADTDLYNPGIGSFSASSLLLGQGTYSMTIAMSQLADAASAQDPTVVPVPAALPLFAGGLAGLMLVARQRRKK